MTNERTIEPSDFARGVDLGYREAWEFVEFSAGNELLCDCARKELKRVAHALKSHLRSPRPEAVNGLWMASRQSEEHTSEGN